MMDFAQCPPNYGHIWRTPRPLVFILGAFLGVAIGSSGVAFYSSIKPARPQSKATTWIDSTILCRSLDSKQGITSFFVENIGPDYKIDSPENIVLLSKTAQGLVPTSAKLILPIYLPSGMTTAIRVNQDSPAPLMLFDKDQKIKIDLEVKGTAELSTGG